MVNLTGYGLETDTANPEIPQKADDLSGYAHRQLIGYVGLSLPILLVLVAGLRPIDVVERWRLLDSISAYYYTGATGIFVGLLVALALFLFTYRGYRNKYHWADRTAAVIAGFAALGVALYPTAAPEGWAAPQWWGDGTGIIHYVSAIVLFSMFAVYSLWLFRLGDGQPDAGKRRRNRIHLICGLVIISCIIWAGIAGWRGNPIFLPEAIALAAFAVSWLVKGHAHRSIRSGVRSVANAVFGDSETNEEG